MGFAGGVAQAGYMTQIRGLAPERCLVVPVDVGKCSAVALVADRNGEVIGAPFEFPLTITGRDQLLARVKVADRAVGGALSTRVGIEAAGHYHRALASSLHAGGVEVVELNPRAVKLARAQLGQSRVKTDVRDCLAMVELLVRGQGWPLHRQDGSMAEQVLWVAQRRRKAEAAQVLGNQVHALADLAFPGLIGCFRTGLDAKALRMLLATAADPAMVARLNAEDLVAHARRHGVRMLRPKATEVIATAANALCVPRSQRQTAQDQLRSDLGLLEALRADLGFCDERLAGILADTPAGVLTSIPGVGVLNASYYGAALGDPFRFSNADAAYRFSGLTPTSYESAGRRGTRVKVSKEGAVEMRQAMIALGFGMSMHHPDFINYKRRMLDAGKRPMIVAVAVAHRAHRLAFAIIRSGRPYDHDKWTTAVAKGRPAAATEEVTATT